MYSRRNLLLWVLYDFANSVVFIVFFLYFAQWVVIDQKMSDFLYNLAFTISAVFLLLTVPISGVLLDSFLRRITGLRFATVLSVVFYGLCGMAALRGSGMTALIFFTLGLYSYQLSFTFYTPLINDITSEKNRGWVSGLGITANFVGNFFGLVIVLPFSNGTWDFFAASQRAEVLLPSVAVFAILSLPMLLFFKEPVRQVGRISWREQWRNLFRETKALTLMPSVSCFLLSFFLFNDAVLTASTNFPIFLEQVWGLPDSVKTYIVLGVLVCCSLGGLLSGLLADRFGHKRTLMVILFGWVLLLPFVGLITNFNAFVAFVVTMGLWFGASWTVSRSVMAYVAPHGKHNLAFAYYGLAERASSFLGPIAWGLIVSMLIDIGPDRYRIAMVAMTGFIVLGIIALRYVRDDRERS